jgi:hypothetical protein
MFDRLRIGSVEETTGIGAHAAGVEAPRLEVELPLQAPAPLADSVPEVAHERSEVSAGLRHPPGLVSGCGNAEPP